MPNILPCMVACRVRASSTHGVARTLEREGVPNPCGGRYWYKRLIKKFILDDVYRPHTFQEEGGDLGRHERRPP
jgi:hypothetical protein